MKRIFFIILSSIFVHFGIASAGPPSVPPTVQRVSDATTTTTNKVTADKSGNLGVGGVLTVGTGGATMEGVSDATTPEASKVTFDANGNLGVGGAISVGTPNSTEGTEVTDQAFAVEDDGGNVIVHRALTAKLTDETEGTVDVVHNEWRIYGGIVGLYRSDQIFAATPVGTYQDPIYGCIVTADRANWDPLLVGSGGAYRVKWDGDSWIDPTAQDD